MPSRGHPNGDVSDRRTLILLLIVGLVGAAAIVAAWAVAAGPVSLVAALAASIAATGVAVSRAPRHEPDDEQRRDADGEHDPQPAPATISGQPSAAPDRPATARAPADEREPAGPDEPAAEATPTTTPIDDPALRWIPSPEAAPDVDGPERPVDADPPVPATAEPTDDDAPTTDRPTSGDRAADDEPTDLARGTEEEAEDEPAAPAEDDHAAPNEDGAEDATTTLPLAQPATTPDASDAGPSRPFLSIDPTPGTLLDPADLGLVTTALGDDGPAVAPYVPRDLDVALDDALGGQLLAVSGGFVVAQGPSGSGLTRTVIEALRRHAGRRPVLVVRRPTPTLDRPLDALLAAVGPGDLTDLDRPIVLIDDAHRHLGRGLDRGLLLELSEALPGCAIVLTVDSVRLALPTITNDPTEDWLRAHIGALTLPDRLSDAELARAFERFPARSLDGRLRWLPAWCSGADERRGRFRDLRVTDPRQAAVLTAATAWQLTTDAPTVPDGLLLRLAQAASGQPPVQGHTTDPDRWTGAAPGPDPDERLRAALDTAHGTGMLTRVDTRDGPAYAVGGELIDELAGEPGRISEQLWDALLDATAPPQAPLLARIAAAAGHDDVAARALTVAVDDPPSAPRAAFELGVVLERLDRLEPAVAAYRRAVTGDDPLHAPMAAFHLGGALEALGRTDAAADAYRWAIDSGHRDAAPLAAFNLGWLHEQQQRTEEAAAAYELAVASEHPDAVPMAAFNLGWLRQQQRRNREAEALYRTAASSSHDDIAPMAALHLGMLLERLQRLREARSLFETVAAGDHTEAASAARLRLQTTRRAGSGRRR